MSGVRSVDDEPHAFLRSFRRFLFSPWLIPDDGLANQRAITLLSKNLSPSQREQYGRDRTFDVIGGRTGVRYRINYGDQMNIEELDGAGRCVRALCFAPQGQVPIGDVMLAQKLALELFEDDALEVAHKIGGAYSSVSFNMRPLGSRRERERMRRWRELDR
jgi:hypothetical protein